MIEIRYFAALRERIGTPRETVDSGALTVLDLITELRALDEGHALAFADPAAIRVALDQELADLASPLAGVREVAFFPPMTGG